MSSVPTGYDRLHLGHPWAYGERPDAHLEEALEGVAPGAAVDLAGGQGRHALHLAERGFDVHLVDLSDAALAQAREAAQARGLTLRTVRANLGFFDPPAGLQAAVAALAMHVPARHTALAAARRLGSALNSGGLMYLSLPGRNTQVWELAAELFAAAGCPNPVVIDHVVTRTERPRLPISRRYEIRAYGFRA